MDHFCTIPLCAAKLVRVHCDTMDGPSRSLSFGARCSDHCDAKRRPPQILSSVEHLMGPAASAKGTISGVGRIAYNLSKSSYGIVHVTSRIMSIRVLVVQAATILTGGLTSVAFFHGGPRPQPEEVSTV